VSKDARRALFERHLRAENARDTDDALGTLTEDCVFEDLAMGRIVTGHAGAREHYELWWRAFKPTVTPERLHWTEDGGAIAEVRWRGYHDGEFLAIKPTHREIDVPVAIFVSFGEGELVAGKRFYYDLSTLRRQLAAG
jgi:steroid delta-isomerase-like uncharacterized protein